MVFTRFIPQPSGSDPAGFDASGTQRGKSARARCQNSRNCRKRKGGLQQFIITALLLGFVFIHGVSYDPGFLLTHTLLEVCITLAFSAVLVCLSMCIPNKAVSAVTGLLLTIILLGSALTISMRLSAPEYTEAFAYTDEASGKLIKVDRKRNDQYLTGTKRKIYTFLYDFLPTCQFYQIVQVSDTPIENYGILIAYDGLLLLLSTGAGIHIFRKKDLK